ncbi:MAG TPA: sulfotransferase [Pseudomonadales bacterium]|nr:sulfotransferase [Pseudomonadales bacterium]
MTLNIIGAGFGRTGTLSLKHALEQLGFDRCYHMMEVPGHDGSAEGWLRAASGKSLDWDTFLQGFQATVDWPACAFWLELHQQYPDAKVILTVRNADKWYASALETIWPFSHVFPRWALALIKPLRRIQNMIDTVIWQGTFGGRFLEPAHAKQVYRDHIDKVKNTIPPQQLLVYEVAQGWEPLCAFLGVPVPATPFPNVNDAESMKRRIRVVRTVITALYALLGGAAAALLYTLAS